MSNRRQFIGGLLAAFGGTTYADPIAASALTADVDGELDVRKLTKWIECYGAETVAGHIVAMLDEGLLNLIELKRRLNQERRRATRQSQSAVRRERHGGDEVLYCGPVLLDAVLRDHITSGFREVKNRGNRIVLVGETSTDYQVMEHIIPAGSRLLIDTRHGVHSPTFACEIVRMISPHALTGDIRCHLYRSRKWHPDRDGTMPQFVKAGQLARGYELSHPRVFGLLGNRI